MDAVPRRAPRHAAERLADEAGAAAEIEQMRRASKAERREVRGSPRTRQPQSPGKSASTPDACSSNGMATETSGGRSGAGAAPWARAVRASHQGCRVRASRRPTAPADRRGKQNRPA
jgi:hypothetical protein